MGKNKLLRYSVIAQRDNVIEEGKENFNHMKGNWSDFFGNDHPIYLELACGRGEYTTGLAAVYPERNYIGIDMKGARIWKGSSVAVENNLHNAAFLRIGMYLLPAFFETAEVEGIWLTFPDPFPKDRSEKNRLTYIDYLKVYKNILSKDGMFHFKTDNLPLFEYTLDVLKQHPELGIRDLEYTKDLYTSDYMPEHHGIETTYERMFVKKGFKINYLKFRFGAE